MDPLHPDNKIEYKDGERVQIAFAGNPKDIHYGQIIGISSRHIIDHWIVLLDNPSLLGWNYRAITAQHTFIKRLGSNEKFLCEV